MHHEDIPEPGTTEAEDAQSQATVMDAVLDAHPTRITLAELIRELAGESPDFGQRDAIERAVRDLVGAGLLHYTDDFVTPTRAAITFSALLDC